MIDLVEIGMKVDSSDFVKAAADTKGFELAVAKMVQTILRENRVLKASSKASADARAEAEQRAIQKQIEAEQKLTATKEREAAKQKAIADRQAKAEMDAYVRTTIAAEKAAAAKAKTVQANVGGNLGLGSTNAIGNGAGFGAMEGEIERLRIKYDSAYAASKLFEAQSKELSFAMLNQAGNADTLKNELDKLQAEYAAFGAGTTDVKNRFVQQAAAVEQSRQGVNKWGLLVQQSGYQAGDFLVQIQSGTNAFVAFGQQATQLVGILPMFAAELGISAVALGGITLGLSIAIPLITAIGAYFMRTSEDAKKAKEQLSDLDSAIKGIDNTLKSWTQTKQAAAQGMTVEQMFGGQSLEQAKTDLGVALRLAEQIQEETRNTTGLDAALLNSIESIWGGGIINRLNAATAEVEKAKQRIIDINAKLVEEQKQNSDDARVALQNEFDMQMSIAKFGEDSAQTKALANKQALDDYNRQVDAQVKANELTEEQGSKLKAANLLNTYLLDITQKLVAAEEKKEQSLIRAYGYYAKTRAESDLIAKANLAEKTQNAADKATFLKNVFHIMAGEAGAVSIELGSWAGAIIAATNASSGLQDFLLKQRIDTGMKGRGLPADYYGMDTAPIDTGSLFGNIEFGPTGAAIKPEDKTKAGGTKKDPLAELQKQIALQEELNGKTEAEQRVRQALGDSWATYSPIVIKGLEEQIQKQIELEDRLKEQQGLYDTIQSSMEDAFMSMEDRTKSAKDAFKSMALAIIKELYNVLVVQRMVGSFNVSTGQGNGIMGAIFKGVAGAFGGGSLSSGPNSGYVAGMAGRASGGPISAGTPYMVGERGPEMIIPKSSGMVLTNGQTKAALGGSSNESYTVHNNISVTGSDSAMVRQEIAKMIPQISSATKAAMIDAKRRGGQMGNAFR